MRPAVPQYAVSLWERGASSPTHAQAAQLERLTDGAVPATSWDDTVPAELQPDPKAVDP